MSQVQFLFSISLHYKSTVTKYQYPAPHLFNRQIPRHRYALAFRILTRNALWVTIIYVHVRIHSHEVRSSIVSVHWINAFTSLAIKYG